MLLVGTAILKSREIDPAKGGKERESGKGSGNVVVAALGIAT